VVENRGLVDAVVVAESRSDHRWFPAIFACAVVAGALWPSRVDAIPVFARVYGKPCHACHTVYPQLNAAGEAFRAHGLHGMRPVIEPIALGPYFAVPGTLPLALQFAFGEDVTYTQSPRAPESTVTHFNFEFLSLLAGGELGPYLSFMADYAPVITVPQTGEVIYPTRPGIAFAQAHAEPWDWLGNLYAGLFELPLGESPRVHRLTVRPYLIYGITAFGLLAQPPPVTDRRTDSLVLASAQIGGEASLLNPDNGFQTAVGVDTGSNNRIDNNDSADFFVRVGQELSTHRLGLFLYYGPDNLSTASERVLRLGPDLTLYSRRARLSAQFLAGWDSNPTGRDVDLWYYGGFLQGDYRVTTELIGLLRFDYVGMPTFNDEGSGGTKHVRRQIWEVTGGAQYLITENLKVVAEVTYSENHEAVIDTTATGLAATLRIAMAFWPLTPPLVTTPWSD
jgi:hypothetical protein